MFRREKKDSFFANLPPEEGKHSLVELNGWGEGWGGKRKFDIVSEMRSGMATKCCGFIVILTPECDNRGKK